MPSRRVDRTARRVIRRLPPAIVLACAFIALGGVAWAGDTLIVEEAFTPDRLGAPANLSIRARFASSADVPPAPVTELTLYGPMGLRIDARGSGTCTEAVLQQRGPTGCPTDSRVGFGGGVAVLALPNELVHEPFTLEFFFAPPEHGRLTLLTYANGVSPVAVSLVVVAHEIPAPKPYGLGFSVHVPQVTTIPGASYASVESAFASIGASDAAYFETIRGRRTLVHVKGLVVPTHCPAGGFPTRGTVVFADGQTFTVTPAIPCPPR